MPFTDPVDEILRGTHWSANFLLPGQRFLLGPSKKKQTQRIQMREIDIEIGCNKSNVPWPGVGT